MNTTLPRREDEILQPDALIKNYTRIANILVDGYFDLMPQEKWLCVCLVRLCGREGSRFLSLRFIAQQTGFSIGALSASKKTGSPGMLWRLHQAGLLHVEIKKRVGADGKEAKQAQFHVTVTDIWQKNYDFFYASTCSTSEHCTEEDAQGVQRPNDQCSEVEHETEKGVRKSSVERSDSSTRVRLLGKIPDSRKITAEAALSDCASFPNEHASAPAVACVVETLTEEEIALILTHRQGTLNGPPEPAKDLQGPTSAPTESKLVESVPQEPTLSTEAVPPSPECASSEEEQVPLARTAEVTTAQEAVQLWEQIRGVRYTPSERVFQLRAATLLLGMELPRTLTPDLLETLSSTYYDQFWKERYGELHLTHLVGIEKSGQVRVVRWIKRLGFQSLPARSTSSPGGLGREEPVSPYPTPNFNDYLEKEEEGDLIQDYLDGKLSKQFLKPELVAFYESQIAERKALAAAGGGAR